MALHVEQSRIPSPKDIFCAKFGKNWPRYSGEDENVKSLQTDGKTDRRQTQQDQVS